MNKVNEILRAALNLLNYSKDVATTNLSSANGSGKLEPKLTDDQLKLVVNLLESSLSQGFQKGLGSFQRMLKNNVSEEVAKKKK